MVQWAIVKNIVETL